MDTTDGAAELHAYLRTQFTDIASAKHFMWRWVNEMDQLLPGFGAISSRALCAHCSAVLEGTPVASAGFCTNYLASKHGSELYWAAWGSEPPNVPDQQRALERTTKPNQ